MTPIARNITIYKGITFTFVIVLRDSLSLIDTFTADNTTNILTTATPHGLTVGDPIQFASEGGELPSPISQGQTYFVLSAPTSSTLTISAEYAGLIFDLTSNGSGTNKAYTNRPIDLTDWLVWSWVKSKPGGSLVLDLDPQIPSPTNGTIDLSKTDEQTALFTLGNFSWDLILQNPGGERLGPLFAGSATILEPITEPA